MNFDQELENKIKEIEQIIKEYLPQCFSGKTDWAKTVTEAINYSVNAGGKRLRPLLMVETYRLFGGTNKVIEPFMAAIEMIHTYSLVHDDLPAMDNDLYRRGKKTTWAVYGEAMAILAGDGLLNYAFETALKSFLLPDGDANRKARALSILAQKAGIYGMIGGQVVDVQLTNQPIQREKLDFIYRLKTGALLEASMMIGALLGGAGEKDRRKVGEIASLIGVAFQIQDDILDVTATTEELGKPVRSDEKNQKTTYVTLEGVEKARRDVKEFSDRAIALLHELPGENPFLEELIRMLITRNK